MKIIKLKTKEKSVLQKSKPKKAYLSSYVFTFRVADTNQLASRLEKIRSGDRVDSMLQLSSFQL